MTYQSQLQNAASRLRCAQQELCLAADDLEKLRHGNYALAKTLGYYGDNLSANCQIISKLVNRVANLLDQCLAREFEETNNAI